MSLPPTLKAKMSLLVLAYLSFSLVRSGDSWSPSSRQRRAGGRSRRDRQNRHGERRQVKWRTDNGEAGRAAPSAARLVPLGSAQQCPGQRAGVSGKGCGCCGAGGGGQRAQVPFAGEGHDVLRTLHLLPAWARAGLVARGAWYFREMDLMGRAGASMDTWAGVAGWMMGNRQTAG